MSEPDLSQRQVFTPSALNALLRGMLDQSVPMLWIEGEISNLRATSSPHWYFSIKDAAAEIRCVMFRNRNQLLRFKPVNGDQVLIRGKVSLYEPRGDLQLQIEHMEPQGLGALMRQLEALKHKLHAEGLFDPARKRSLPRFPRRLAVITSAQGAAWHDVRTVLARRYPLLEVDLLPSLVQGPEAPAALIRALRFANAQDYDLILLTRGGGSIEDLFAFNDEALVRAIVASRLPVLAAIGHEIDLTLAELAADLRAATPSAAAELLAPDRQDLAQRLDELAERLQAALERQLRQGGLQLQVALTALKAQHPERILQQWQQRLQRLSAELLASMNEQRAARERHLERVGQRLLALSPASRVQTLTANLQRLHDTLQVQAEGLIDVRAHQLDMLGAQLHALSPLATLDRGYALTWRGADLVTDPAHLQPGDALRVQWARGQASVQVQTLEPSPSAGGDPPSAA